MPVTLARTRQSADDAGGDGAGGPGLALELADGAPAVAELDGAAADPLAEPGTVPLARMALPGEVGAAAVPGELLTIGAAPLLELGRGSGDVTEPIGIIGPGPAPPLSVVT
jgi:hypothetical protein